MSSSNDDYIIGINVISSPTYTSNRKINIGGSRKDRNFLFLESQNMGFMPVSVGIFERVESQPGGDGAPFFWDDLFDGG